MSLQALQALQARKVAAQELRGTDLAEQAPPSEPRGTLDRAQHELHHLGDHM